MSQKKQLFSRSKSMGAAKIFGIILSIFMALYGALILFGGLEIFVLFFLQYYFIIGAIFMVIGIVALIIFIMKG